MRKKYRYLNQHLKGLKNEYKETGDEQVKYAIQELSEVLRKSRLYDLAMKIHRESRDNQ